MPKLTNSVPKYRKHKQSGQAIVTVNCRDHLLGPHGTKASKIEYDRLISEWLASGRSAGYGAPPSDYSVAEMSVDYLQYAKKYYGAGVRGTYANIVRAVRPLARLYGRTVAGEFGVLQFKTVRQSLLDGGDLSRVYVNETMRRIVGMFRWGAAEGKIPASVPTTLGIIPGLRKGRSEAKETAPIRPVAKAIVEATLPHLSTVVAAMVRLQMLTGARPGEICRLRTGDVDRSGDVWEARLVEHKTAHHGQSRTIYIGPRAQEVLRPFLLRGPEDCCFSPRDAINEMRAERSARRKTLLSCGNRPGTNKRKKPQKAAGSFYTTQSYGRAIARACELAFPAPVEIADDAAAVKAWRHGHHWAPNQLRHALATRVRREFDLDAAKTLLGHASIGTTEVYAEQDRGRAIEVARKIG